MVEMVPPIRESIASRLSTGTDWAASMISGWIPMDSAIPMVERVPTKNEDMFFIVQILG